MQSKSNIKAIVKPNLQGFIYKVYILNWKLNTNSCTLQINFDRNVIKFRDTQIKKKTFTKSV